MAKMRPDLWMNSREINDLYRDQEELKKESDSYVAGPVEKQLSKGKGGRRTDPSAARKERQRDYTFEHGLNMDFDKPGSKAMSVTTTSAVLPGGIRVVRKVTPNNPDNPTAYKLEQYAVWDSDGEHKDFDRNPDNLITIYKKDDNGEIVKDQNGRPIIVATQQPEIMMPHQAGDIAYISEYTKGDPIILRESQNNSDDSINTQAMAWAYAVNSDSEEIPDYNVTIPALLDHWDEIAAERKKKAAAEDLESIKRHAEENAAIKAKEAEDAWVNAELEKRWPEVYDKSNFDALGKKMAKVLKYAYALKNEIPEGERIGYTVVPSEVNSILRYGIDNESNKRFQDIKPWLFEALSLVDPDMSDEDAERFFHANKTAREAASNITRQNALRENLKAAGRSDDEIERTIARYINNDLGHDKFGSYVVRGLGMNAYNATPAMELQNFQTDPIYDESQWPSYTDMKNKIKNAAGEDIDEWTSDTDDNGDTYWVRHYTKPSEKFVTEKVRHKKMRDVAKKLDTQPTDYYPVLDDAGELVGKYHKDDPSKQDAELGDYIFDKADAPLRTPVKKDYRLAYDEDGNVRKGYELVSEPLKDEKDRFVWEEAEEQRPVYDYSFNNGLIDYLNRRDKTSFVDKLDENHKPVKEVMEDGDGVEHEHTVKEEKELYYNPALRAFREDMEPKLRLEYLAMTDPEKAKELSRMQSRQHYQALSVLEAQAKRLADEKRAEENWTEQGLRDYFNSDKVTSKDKFVLNNMRAINAADPLSVLVGARYPYELSVNNKQRWLDDFLQPIENVKDVDMSDAGKIVSSSKKEDGPKKIVLKRRKPAEEPKKKIVVKKKPSETQQNILKGLKGE